MLVSLHYWIHVELPPLLWTRKKIRLLHICLHRAKVKRCISGWLQCVPGKRGHHQGHAGGVSCGPQWLLHRGSPWLPGHACQGTHCLKSWAECLYICVCVYVCVCVCVCVYYGYSACVCIYVLCMSVYEKGSGGSVFMCLYGCGVCVCAQLLQAIMVVLIVCLCTCIFICLCVWVCVSVYVCVCVIVSVCHCVCVIVCVCVTLCVCVCL